MKKLIIRIAIAIVAVLVLAVAVSAFYLDSILKKGVETVGPQITKTDVKLHSASLSVLSGSGSVKGLFIGNPEGFKSESAIKVGTVKLAVKPKSVFSEKIHVTEVKVEAPEITFEGGLGTKNNLSKLLDNVQAATGGKGASQPTDKASSRKIQVDDFVIRDGKINLSVNLPGILRSATVPLPEIRLKDLGTGPEGITTADLTAKILREVLQQAIPAAEKAATDLAKGATEAVKGIATDLATGSVQKATKSVTDLFKKK